MSSNGFIGSVYNISEWITRLLVINLLWIFFNLPVIYVALNLLTVESMNALLMVGITIAMIIPFITWPATTAMFSVTRKWVMKETDFSIIRYFWHYYKTNYVKSMFIGFIIVIIWLIYAVDYYFVMYLITNSFSPALQFFISFTFLLLFITLFVFTFNCISYSVHLNGKISVLLKDALIITIGNPLISLSIAGVNGFIIYVSFSFFTFLIPFFMGALIAIVSFTGFNLVYRRLTVNNPHPKQQVETHF